MKNSILNPNFINEEVNNLYSEEKNIEQDNPGYYSVIPANVRYDVDLCPNAKLLYGEITALCNKKGYCWATNKYFSRLYQVSTVAVSKWINQLVKKGYIFSIIKYEETTNYFLETVIIKKRILSLQPLKNDEEGVVKENFKGVIKQKFKGGIKQKFKYNNISINNTRINNKERKEENSSQLSYEKLNFKNEKTKNEENIFEPKKVSKKENEKSFNVLIEEFSQNEVLCFELKEHLKIRKLNKAPLTNHALELSFKRLDSLSNSDDEKIAIVQKSIEYGWTGFFPLKPYEKIQKRPSPVSQNTGYNIDEYENCMDTFAPTQEELKKLERKRNDEIKKQEFYKSFTIGDTPEDQRELTPEEYEETEKEKKEFLKKINDSVGFTNEDIAAAFEEQKRMENERRKNCFWF